MFTWVCQRCGREVDVAEVECPHCAVESARTAFGSARGSDRRKLEDVYPSEPEESERLPLPSRQEKPPTPALLPPPPSAFSVRPFHLLLVALVLLASLAFAVYLARPDLMTVEGVSLPKLPTLATPEPPLQTGSVEVAGVRTWRDVQSKLRVRAVLINHTEGPLSDLAYKVSLRDPASAEDAPPAATFEVQLEEPLGPRESREIETDLIAPEGLTALPNWNRMRVNLETPPEPVEPAADR